MTTLIAKIQTDKGTIHLNLFPEHAPTTVANFVHLSQKGFYENNQFHRVVDNFVIQGGCPEGSGRGGPGYRFQDEFHPDLTHSKPGILSMANAGPATNGSQFFITHVPTPHLDNNHSVFGEVATPEDLEIVMQVRQGDMIKNIEIEGDVDAFVKQHAEQIQAWTKAMDNE